MDSSTKKKLLDAEAIARYDPFSSHNNIRVTATYEDGSGEGELIVTRESLNPHGIVHGGCLAALAASVGGTNQKIRCRATPEKTGRTLSVYHVSLTDDEGLEVATGNFTFFMMDKRLNGTTPERLEHTADES